MHDKSESSRYEDWFSYGQRDLQNAKLLLRYGGSTDTIAFFFQQSVEKHLKGYLIKHGWKLKKIHDVEVLLSIASRHSELFKEYLDFSRVISAVYVESRYPLGPPKEYSKKQITEWLEQTESLITLVKGLT
jgi:HEPN domain-containing protein